MSSSYEKQLEQQNEQLRERLETVLQDATNLVRKLNSVKETLNRRRPTELDKSLAKNRVIEVIRFLEELSKK